MVVTCRSCGKEIINDFILYKPTNIGIGKKIYYEKFRMNIKGIEDYIQDINCDDLFILCDLCYLRSNNEIKFKGEK